MDDGNYNLIWKWWVGEIHPMSQTFRQDKGRHPEWLKQWPGFRLYLWFYAMNGGLY